MHKVYCISGLGANHRVFEKLDIPKGLIIKHIRWIVPKEKETIESYTIRMSKQINEKENFSLIGLSFGGIIAQQMSQIVNPTKIVIISTIKDRGEMPLWLKAIAKFGIHRLVPVQFFTNDGVLSYAFFRKLISRRMPSFNRYFEFKDHTYLRWSIDQFLNWNPKKRVKGVIHIHGDNDLLLPISKIKYPTAIQGGSHLMILFKARQVSEELSNIFN